MTRFLRARKPQELARPQLDLSGPLLSRAFESLVTGTDAQGGVEYWIDALKLKSRMFEQALGQGTTDARLAAFCGHFPEDSRHRWVRDLAAEILHSVDPERYPLMNRWIWDRKANTGVIREIWFGDEVDNSTLNVPDGYDTYLMLREELSQFLTDNGVFRDVIWYVDLLCAKIYADYIAAQGGVYLRADFSSPGDPMEHARRLLGLDGVRAGSGRTRLKAITGEAFVIEGTNPLDSGSQQ